MNIITDFEQTSFKKINKVVTIGVFDGVHLGHIAVLNELQKIAEEKNAESCLLTFNPHPKLVLEQIQHFKVLNLFEEKLKLLQKTALQNIIILPFTKAFSEYSAEEFVKNILIDVLQIQTLVIGYDHKMGKNRQGDFQHLKKLQEKYNFELIQLLELKNNQQKISSTEIRNYLNEGKITNANALLGYDYFLEGKVIQGNKIGKTIGFPTANLQIDSQKLLPKKGSYIVEIFFKNEKFSGMMNIGNRPTIDGKSQSVEVNIFGFEGDLYGKNLRIAFKDFLRDEVKFDSIEQLRKQLKNDLIKSKKFF